MNFEEFNAEYGQVLERIKRGRCDTDELAAEYSRLADGTAGIDDSVERELIDRDLQTLNEMVDLGRDNDEPDDAWTLTSDALRRANNPNGTPAERIARAEDAISEIRALAKSAPEHQQDALLRSTDTLNLLISSLRATTPDQPPPAE